MLNPRSIFPHASEFCHPIVEFKIKDRMLSLYIVSGLTPSASYSLYWNDQNNPVQHAMTDYEVFHVISGILEAIQI